MSVLLRPISRSAADALLARRTPTDVEVAADHPTEFSAGIAEAVGGGSPLGPFFVHRARDEVVIGEIGGGFVAADTVEIGYALVPSCWGRGYATDAVRALVDRARDVPAIARDRRQHAARPPGQRARPREGGLRADGRGRRRARGRRAARQAMGARALSGRRSLAPRPRTATSAAPSTGA